LHEDFALTVIPNDNFRLEETKWSSFLRRLGIQAMALGELPKKLEGFALSLCNRRFYARRIAERAKQRGLKIIWSSEMMWHHPGEAEAMQDGLIDKVLYVSELQKRVLAEGYNGLPSIITGNYIDPRFFPFKERRHKTFTIGRLSRADPEKYTEDFPVFYECLGLPDTRFRVMAWSKDLGRKYRWHHFDHRWDLLPAEAESQRQFLYSLDLFVYTLGYTFKEAWGRSTVEAMLTGAIPLVPDGHHLEHLMVHGESGFVCKDFTQYQEHAQRLYYDFPYRQRIAAQARQHAEEHLCNREEHLRIWKEVFQ
jgi:hypothetical protein